MNILCNLVNNLCEMVQLFESCKLPRLTRDEMNSLTNSKEAKVLV